MRAIHDPASSKTPERDAISRCRAFAGMTLALAIAATTGCDRPTAATETAPTSTDTPAPPVAPASVAPPPAPPAPSARIVDHARALAEAEAAMPDCKLHFWQECDDLLGKAVKDDPSIASDPRYKELYRRASYEMHDSKAPDDVEVANRKRLKRPRPPGPGQDASTPP